MTKTKNLLPKLDQDRSDALAPFVSANLEAIQDDRQDALNDQYNKNKTKATGKFLGAAIVASMIVAIGVKGVQDNHARHSGAPSETLPAQIR